MNTQGPTQQPELSLAIIEDLRGKGYTQSDIARMYGVTRQYVSWIKHYYGGRLTPPRDGAAALPISGSGAAAAGGVSIPEAPRARRVHGNRRRRYGRPQAQEASRLLQEAPRSGHRV
ncbi:hypothetical protein SEA_NOELLA_74 [Mycobacterium phage Noella]|nr:hypothetical protein SEA_NOELLA_74 [Mycobacterium phage Noella]